VCEILTEHPTSVEKEMDREKGVMRVLGCDAERDDDTT